MTISVFLLSSAVLVVTIRRDYQVEDKVDEKRGGIGGVGKEEELEKDEIILF